MHSYTPYINSPKFPHQYPYPSKNYNKHSLPLILSLTFIKSAASRLYMTNISFAFKQIQFKILEQSRSLKILGEKSDHNSNCVVNQNKGKAFYKEKSLQILRKIQTSLDKKKVCRSEQPRLLSKSLVMQRNKIIEQIAQKLEVKNRSPPIKGEERQRRPHLNRRIARLQSFMQQIKRQRQLNQKPTLILEKKQIDRINYHMLQQKLEEERKKIDGLNKHRQIFGNLQEIREELKSMKKTQEMFANPETIQDNSNKHIKIQANYSQQIITEVPNTPTKADPQVQIYTTAQPQSFQFSRPKVRFINSGSSSIRRVSFVRPQGQ